MALILSGSDGLSDVDGSAATPAIRGTDANTGIFFPAADTIAFSEGGVETARFDSSGNFGLGVTPSAWGLGKALEVGNAGNAMWSVSSGDVRMMANAYYNGSNYIYSTTAAASYYRQSSSAHQWYTAASGTAGNTVTFTQAMTLDADGDLGIGVTSPARKLSVSSGSTSAVYLQLCNTTSGTGVGQGFELFSDGTNAGVINRQNGYLEFDTNNIERARITSGGDFGIGSTSPNLGGLTRALTINTPTGGNYSGVELAGAGTLSARFITNNAAGTFIGSQLSIPLIFETNATERARITSAGYVGINTSNPTAGFANYQTTSQLSSGAVNATGVWTVTNTTSASNNATTDVLRMLNVSGSALNGYISGHVYVVATGASGGNGFSAVYALGTTSNGTTNSTFTLVTSVSRGTNPVASVAIANDGGGGAVKVQVTWINNSGVVTGGGCNASFVGFAS